MKKVKILTFALLFVLAGTGFGTAGSLDTPNVFTPETPARADSVNENFSAIEVSVDDNALMITSLQSAHSGTRTGYLSIGCTAFQPALDGYNYNMTANQLITTDNLSPWYFATANLPDGSEIISVTGTFYDNSPVGDAAFSMVRTNQWGAAWQVASGATFGVPGNVAVVDAVADLPIDNVTYAYQMQVILPDGAMKFFRMLIEYEYTLD